MIWVRGGTTGRYLDAMRGSEVAAASIGINHTPRADRRVRAVGRDRRARRRPDDRLHAPRHASNIDSVLRARARPRVGRARRHARVAHGRGRDQRRDRLRVLPGGGPAHVDPVARQPRAARVPHERRCRPALQPILFGLGALTYAKHPEGILEFQKRTFVRVRSSASIDRFGGKGKAGTPRPTIPAARPWSRRRAAAHEPARPRTSVTKHVRGHHRARRREPRRRARARSSGSSARTARARRRSSTACSALLRPDGGTVTLRRPRPHAACPTHRRARLGIGRTFQRIELFAGMTPREHFLVAERVRSGKRRAVEGHAVHCGRPDRRRERSAAQATLELLGLGAGRRPPGRVAEPRRRPARRDRAGADDRSRSSCCSTSRRRVSTAHETAALGETLRDRAARSRGSRSCSSSTTSSFVRSLVERVFVLDFGTLIASGPTDDGVRRQRRPQGLPRGPRLMAAVPSPARRGRAAARAARRRRRRTGRSARSSASRSRSPAGARARAARLERRGQDHDRPRVLRARSRRRRARCSSTATTSPAARTYQFARLGIIHAPEGRSVFASLTVEENLELTFRRSRGRAGVREALDEAYTLFPRLGERRTQLAGTLSGGEQRMLSLARVLVEQPRLLIADELSLGLAPIIVDEVYRTLADDPRRGHHAADRRAARAPRARDRRRRDRAREGRGRLLRARCRSSATCRRGCSAAATSRPPAPEPRYGAPNSARGSTRASVSTIVVALDAAPGRRARSS